MNRHRTPQPGYPLPDYRGTTTDPAHCPVCGHDDLDMLAVDGQPERIGLCDTCGATYTVLPPAISERSQTVSAPTPELAAAQAESATWRARAEQWHTRAMDDTAAGADAQAEIVRLRVGLQDLWHAAAVEALHDGNPNAVRAKFTALTTQIEQLLGLGAGDPAWAAASAGELTAALSQALIQRSELQAEVARLRSELQAAVARQQAAAK